MEQVKQKVAEKVGEEKTSDGWTDFVQKVGEWLLGKKAEQPGIVSKALAGLILDGITNEEELQNIANDKKDFCETLVGFGVPAAICDLLFEEYVTPKAQRGISSLFSLSDGVQRIDGINFRAPHIKRDEKVRGLLGTLKNSGLNYIVIGSPPGSGKTSLLALTGDLLEKEHNMTVKYFYVPRNIALEKLENEFAVKVKIDEERPANEQLWVLIDDAQNAFGENFEVFWTRTLKNPHGNVCFIIASTYDMNIEGSPVSFAAAPRFSSLELTDSESRELFAAMASMETRKEPPFWGQWDDFRKELLDFSGGSVGIFMAGLRMLYTMECDAPKGRQPCSESDGIALLRQDNMKLKLMRCFPPPKDLTSVQQDHVVAAIFGTSQSHHAQQNITDKEIDQGNKPFAEVIRLERGGVLKPRGGGFRSPAAAFYYFNCLFAGRAEKAPEKVEELVVRIVKDMSTSFLRHSCDEGNFPKLAVFQQMFFMGLSKHIPAKNLIIPEKNTYVVDKDGEYKLTGEVDFYINNDLQWALELVQNGESSDSHMGRFASQNGKYRGLQPKTFLVVDCRPGPPTRVRTWENRCILFFSNDLRNCSCQMHNGDIVELELKD